jgi:fibronectin-binding autotransporter adhesin
MIQQKARDWRRGDDRLTGNRRRLQPTLMALEERQLLSTFTVTNTLDDGSVGSLRYEIGLANAAGGTNTIAFNTDPSQGTDFDTPQTITLAGTPLELSTADESATIAGPAGGLTISGGGVSRVFQVDNGVTASISDLTITGGSTAENGAGLYNSGTSALVDCTISGNTAVGGSVTNEGGGIFNSGTLSVTSSTIAYNQAAYGYYYYSATSGGGIFNGGLLTVTGSTISNNSAAYPGGGGGLENAGGTTTLTNTIVAGNTYSFGGNSDVGGAVSGTFTLIGTGGSGGLTNGIAGNLVGVANPVLGTLGNYGGPTETIPLLPGSPAIDAGTSAGASTTDQRGEPRVGGVDIGAFESQGFTMTPATVSTPQTAAIGTAFTNSLTVTVTANNPVEPVDGGVVTFVANPATDGASAGFLSSTSVALAGGQASASVAPNNMDGSYRVSGTAQGSSPATFSLTNTGAVFNPLLVNTPSDALFPGSGLLSLREAVFFANWDLVGNVNIGFDPNLFSTAPTITLTGGEIALDNPSETEAITASAAGLTVSGGGQSQVFQVAAGASASFSGLTITGANSTSPGGALSNGGTTTLFDCILMGNAIISVFGGNGGAISNTGMLTLTNCLVTDNTATTTSEFGGSEGGGGGIFNSGTLSLINSTVSDNVVGASSFLFRGGGGIFNNGTLTLTGCTVSGNSLSNTGRVASSAGGGIYNFVGKATLTNCVVSGNSADFAGGLSNTAGTLTLTNCTVSGNSATSAGGVATGGFLSEAFASPPIYYSSPGTTTLNGCTISGNTAVVDGGGVLAGADSTTTLNDTTVSENSAASGGGLFIRGTSFGGSHYGVSVLDNCNVSDNHASGNGGGLAIVGFGSATLTNCAVSGNSASNGGGAYAKGYTGSLYFYGQGYVPFTDLGTTKFTNCTISGNSASGDGGGLDNAYFGSATMSSTNINSNTAVAGGGISNEGTLNVASGMISNNKAQGGSGASGIGGGVDSSGGSVAISNTVLSGNMAKGGAGGDGIGGGLALGNNATATITNSKFARNLAIGGAGGSGVDGGDGIGGAIAVAIDSIVGESDAS